MDNGFDTPDSLRDLSEERYKEVGIPSGHRSRVTRALFSGVDILAAPSHAPPPPPSPAGSHVDPVVNVAAPNVTVQRQKVKFDVPIPGSVTPCGPDAMLDFGLLLRNDLRERVDLAFGDLAFSRFTKAWNDLDPAYPHAGPEDVVLATVLFHKDMPQWASSLVRGDLQRDHGMRALHTLCRQVFTRTNLSDRDLKRRVRYPEAAARPRDVAHQLASYDADVSDCVDVRKFPLDDDDKIQAYEAIVSGLNAFKASVELLKLGKAPAEEWRARLGEIADEHKGVAPGLNKSAPGNESLGGSGPPLSEYGDFGDRAARAVAAVHHAMGRPKPSGKKDFKRPVDKKLCLWKLVHGQCTKKDCRYSHDPAQADERDQLVAAVMRFWDGASIRMPAVMDLVSSAMQVFKTARVPLQANLALLRTADY